MSDQLYDVVIYDLLTFRVVSIFRRNLPRRGDYSAEHFRESAELRINTNDKMSAIVEAGEYKAGDVYQE